jgi:hypothetical protein
MAENTFEKFNEMFDLEGLQQDIDNAANNTGDFVEVPHGDYEVKISKIEMGATGEKSKNPGAPMAKVWFTIIAGEFKNQKIFMNQILTTGFGIHKMNKFLDSLESGVAVTFENFAQYADVFAKVFEAVDGAGEYQLAYMPNKKNANFSEYEIIKRFK